MANTSGSQGSPQAATPSTTLEPPFVNVEGVPNFRDLGGLPCFGPRESADDTHNDASSYIRPRYLFRCAQPTQITPTGIATLTSALDVRHTYDLRSGKELRLVEARFPNVPVEIPGVMRHHIPIYKDEEYSPISMGEGFDKAGSIGEKDGDKNPALSEEQHSHDGFINAYEDILRRAGATGSYRTIVLHILDRPEEPLAWHCTLGKDRTGIFAALLLRLCGVEDNAIVLDYALTTQGLGKWREYLVRRLMAGAGGEYVQKSADGHPNTEQRPPTREEAERIIGSHPADMWTFLEMLDTKFGGARQYFRDFCGFSDEQLDQVVRTLVVESDELSREAVTANTVTGLGGGI